MAFSIAGELQYLNDSTKCGTNLVIRVRQWLALGSRSWSTGDH